MLKVQATDNHRTDIFVIGDFDAAAAREYRDELECVANTVESAVVLDFSKVPFLDSSGIGAIVFLYKRLTARRIEFSIIGAAGQPLQVMQTLRINRTIPINVVAARANASGAGQNAIEGA